MSAQRSAVISALAAQGCSFLTAATGVAAEYIALDATDITAFQVNRQPVAHSQQKTPHFARVQPRTIWAPPSQCFLTYALVALVFGTLTIVRSRTSGGAAPAALRLSAPLGQYALLAAVDVHANILVVKAFRYTSLTSVSLLDSASVPAAMALSQWLLRCRYRRRHLAGCAVVVAGYLLLVASDALCREATAPAGFLGGDDNAGGGGSAAARLFGDALTVSAACLYATSNVLQERLLVDAPTVEVLAMFGLLGKPPPQPWQGVLAPQPEGGPVPQR